MSKLFVMELVRGSRTTPSTESHTVPFPPAPIATVWKCQILNLHIHKSVHIYFLLLLSLGSGSSSFWRLSPKTFMESMSYCPRFITTCICDTIYIPPSLKSIDSYFLIWVWGFFGWVFLWLYSVISSAILQEPTVRSEQHSEKAGEQVNEIPYSSFTK